MNVAMPALRPLLCMGFILMKAKRGYKEQKNRYSTGNWLKRYFEKRTTRKSIKPEDIQCPVCGYYCLGKGGYGCIDKPSLLDT